MKYDVFISYSRKDKVVVDSFVERFEKSGITCWIDRTGIETGDAFKNRIVKAIRNSHIVVYFSSANSNSSEWTEKEINTSIHLKKTIVPVKLDNSEYTDSILFDLGGLDYVDYTIKELRKDALDRLVVTISHKLGELKPNDENTIDESDERTDAMTSIVNGVSQVDAPQSDVTHNASRRSKPKLPYFSKDVTIGIIVQVIIFLITSVY